MMSLDLTPYQPMIPHIPPSIVSTISKPQTKRDDSELSRDFTQSSLYSNLFGSGEDRPSLLQSLQNR